MNGAALTLAAVLLAAAPRAEPPNWYTHVWGTFGFHSGFLIGGDYTVKITEYFQILPTGPSFWGLERHEELLRPGSRRTYTRTTWVDGRRCPALAARFKKISSISGPQPQSPGERPILPLATDSGLYSIDVPAGYGEGAPAHLVVANEYQGPVVNWVKDTLKAVEGCWRETPPVQAKKGD